MSIEVEAMTDNERNNLMKMMMVELLNIQEEVLGDDIDYDEIDLTVTFR